MIDLKKLRENPEFFKKATADKQRDPKLVDEILKLDDERRKVLQRVEILRAERNKLGKENIERAKQIKIELNELEEKLWHIENNKEEPYLGLNALLWKLPNPALEGVPVGKDEGGNVEIRKWGELPKFNFPVKAHCELGESLDLVDTERAGKVSGTRFGYLKNEAVLIELALIDLGMKKLLKKGFTPIFPPVMIQKEVMSSLGYNNYGFEETYVLPDDHLCLIATAEHAIVPYFKDEILKEDELPKRFIGYSSAFRREAGSYGKDTKGILRVHQFNKLEMVSLVKPEDSENELEMFLSIEEELMQALKIPYHVVKMCTGDLGDPAAAKYDIEAWFPAESKYRETHSCSNCTDYQARRLNIRYKKSDGKMEFVHILNGTVFSERPILAILENYQQADGTVEIPEVLRNYVGKDTIFPKR